MTDFVHLHVHTEYSILDGMCRIPDLISTTKEMGMSSIAITDHGGMFGVIPFYNEAKKQGIKPIIGCEVYVAKTHRTARDARSISDAGYHLVLLAQDKIGYNNLMALSSIGYMEGFYYKPRVDRESLKKHRDGLIALSACLGGEIPSKILAKDYSAARRVTREHIELFGANNFFIELQSHGIPEQAKVNVELITIAKELDVGLVASNDTHYVNQDDHYPHDILLCIQTGKTYNEKNRMRFPNNNFYLKSPDEMAAMFGEVPGALSNTVEIAERCNLELTFDEYQLPTIEAPEGYTNSRYLRELVEKGRPDVYPNASKEVDDQIDYELGVIESMGFIDYFLIVWDLVNFSRSQGIQVGPGRGSGAGSIVAYCLGITGVDPLKHKLVFERFLNPERISMPDFDLDFGDRRRGEIVQYISDKYGVDNVAQIITFGTLGSRAVIKDVGRVLQVPYNDVDQLSKMINPTKKLRVNLEENEAFANAYKNNEQDRKLIDTAMKLEGQVRHPGVHAAGVVVTPDRIRKFVPLYRGKKDEQVTQYDMSVVDSIGLLKIDVLGLKTLTVIDDCIKAINRRRGFIVDFGEIDENDTTTYKMLAKGETEGVFQLESDGMKDLCRRIKPRTFAEMVPIIALFRPGPMGAKDSFVNRSQGKESAKAFHPALDDILNDSRGILLYQEHVLRLAAEIAGFTLGEADILRRAMGKKKIDEMHEQKSKFIAGATKRGMSERDATMIFEKVEPFAKYGFNKAHTVAYAVLAFQTAYLKANYTVEFMAALLTADQGNSDKVAQYIKIANVMGIEILPPDINESWINFWVADDTTVRMGMAAIKGIGESAIEEIILARNEDGPYKSLTDFCGRIEQKSVNRGAIEGLIKCGAFDNLGFGRKPLFIALDDALEIGKKAHRDRLSGQESLLGSWGNDEDNSDVDYSYTSEEWNNIDLLSYEKESLGLALSGHPLDKYEDLIARFTSAPIEKILNGKNGVKIRAAGVIIRMRVIEDKKKRDMCFLTIEDSNSEIEIVVFASVYEKSEFALFMDRPILVRGKLDTARGAPKILANEIIPLDDVESSLAKSCHITIRTEHGYDENLTEIMRIIEKHRGKCALVLRIRRNGREAQLQTSPDFCVNPGKAFIVQIERLLGKGSVTLN